MLWVELYTQSVLSKRLRDNRYRGGRLVTLPYLTLPYPTLNYYKQFILYYLSSTHLGLPISRSNARNTHFPKQKRGTVEETLCRSMLTWLQNPPFVALARSK